MAAHTAALQGGFLLILGDSSVGKTRMAHHLIHEFVPDFALVHPDTAELIVHLADATFPLPKLVVWLDELQYYLQGPHQRGTTYLTATTIRKLLDARGCPGSRGTSRVAVPRLRPAMR